MHIAGCSVEEDEGVHRKLRGLFCPQACDEAHSACAHGHKALQALQAHARIGPWHLNDGQAQRCTAQSMMFSSDASERRQAGGRHGMMCRLPHAVESITLPAPHGQWLIRQVL